MVSGPWAGCPASWGQLIAHHFLFSFLLSGSHAQFHAWPGHKERKKRVTAWAAEVVPPRCRSAPNRYLCTHKDWLAIPLASDHAAAECHSSLYVLFLFFLAHSSIFVCVIELAKKCAQRISVVAAHKEKKKKWCSTVTSVHSREQERCLVTVVWALLLASAQNIISFSFSHCGAPWWTATGERKSISFIFCACTRLGHLISFFLFYIWGPVLVLAQKKRNEHFVSVQTWTNKRLLLFFNYDMVQVWDNTKCTFLSLIIYRTANLIRNKSRKEHLYGSPNKLWERNAAGQSAA